MNKLYFLDVGFVEDTIIYELVPKKVATLKNATADDIARYLRDKNIRTLVIDSAQPNIIDSMKQRRAVKKILKTLRLPKEQS